MADSVQYKSLPEVLYCKMCNYYTCNKKQIEKHFISSKHIKNSSISLDLHIEPASAEKPATNELPSHSDITLAPPNTPTDIICECCGKTYKRKRALLRHQENVQRQQSIKNDQDNDNDPENDKDKNNDNDQENIDKSLELITDDSESDSDSDSDSDNSSNTEFEHITFDPLIIDPLIINHDAAYFIQTFIYSIDILIGISVFISKIFSFFSLKSNNHSD